MSTTTAYINGIIYTMEEEGETCSAVVVRDGKFLYCGTDEQAKAMADEVVDLKGAPVLPGLIDTHQHVFAYARNLTKLDLSGTTSLKELKERVRDYAAGVPDGQWILGFGFDHEKFDVPKLPTRYDLDEACPNNPLIITRNCLHVNVANSLALKAGGSTGTSSPRWPARWSMTRTGNRTASCTTRRPVTSPPPSRTPWPAWRRRRTRWSGPAGR